MPSRFLNLHCSRCDARVVRYKKEGSGRLVRVYLDRIEEPENLRALKHVRSKSDLPPLDCRECGQPVGIPMIHGSENRPAYRLVKGSFRRKEA
ncbi:hypothetical protein UR09_03765 [Candidatus Nitromaritima sp. SCGC AAA799-A02]|nr:hypothetical protein UR09_03765 [Candidatus Nitromaritima sp. SCGC AAA799-A02]KMP12188.1 hypothetical protein UZ36_01870 [Candidatus Nitromaritima sp. SCGC AAA799-C22]